MFQLTNTGGGFWVLQGKDFSNSTPIEDFPQTSDETAKLIQTVQYWGAMATGTVKHRSLTPGRMRLVQAASLKAQGHITLIERVRTSSAKVLELSQEGLRDLIIYQLAKAGQDAQQAHAADETIGHLLRGSNLHPSDMIKLLRDLGAIPAVQAAEALARLKKVIPITIQGTTRLQGFDTFF